MYFNTDEDFALALQLQYGEDKREDLQIIKTQTSNSKYSIVDESLELIDPTPDVFAMFREFDRAYFWGKLECCALKWSPQMTLCAGMCRYEGRGGLCSIHLSQPLLKLRPRKDLVETLLHEMIHAYLFVTNNNKDHNAHGPEFVKHMDRLNQLTGSKITIYHSFHDEVDSYRKHVWQCNGPCRTRKPYFGLLKRAKNRAPGPSDRWWVEHEASCGGKYIKIQSPEESTGKTSSDKKTLNDRKSPPFKTKQDIFEAFKGHGNVLGSSTGTNSSEVSKNTNRKLPLEDAPKSSSANAQVKSDVKNGSKRLKQMDIENYIPSKSSKVATQSKVPAPSVIIIDDEPVRLQCPVCQLFVDNVKLNDHLDQCLM